jgi:hypothetical protein
MLQPLKEMQLSFLRMKSTLSALKTFQCRGPAFTEQSFASRSTYTLALSEGTRGAGGAKIN